MEIQPAGAGPAGGHRRARARAWRAEVENARSVHERFSAHGADLDQLATVAPVLVDSAYSAPFWDLLDSLPPPEIERRPRLALARARQYVVQGRRQPARSLIALVLSSARDDDALVARAYWELGCLDLADDQVASAEVVLELGREALGTRAERCPDLQHLEALIAERHGDKPGAVLRYRDAIARGERALTLLTRVIALRNLAASLDHDDPRSAAGLCGLALALFDGDALDERTRPSVENVLAYSLLCDGQVRDAQRHADGAAADAVRLGHPLVACYARYNSAVALELMGSAEEAGRSLMDLETVTDAQGFVELTGWVRLRRAWLAVKLGRPADAVVDLERHFAHDEGTVYRDSVATLRALIAYRDGRLAAAIDALQRLVERYAQDEDWLTAFVLMLWLASAHDLAGDRREAASAVAAAASIGRPRRFRLSPNWWSDELVTVARRLLPESDSGFARLLVATGERGPSPTTPRVIIDRAGGLSVDGRPLADERWRQGRSGSGVLRRLFGALVSAHPVGIERDELADLLWPESDGDRATQNLDSALNDLRHLLRGVAGLQIGSADGRYRLIAGGSVTFDRADP